MTTSWRTTAGRTRSSSRSSSGKHRPKATGAWKRFQAPVVVYGGRPSVLLQHDVAINDPDKRLGARAAAKLHAERRDFVPVIPAVVHDVDAVHRNVVAEQPPVEREVIHLRAAERQRRGGQLDAVVARV